MRVVVKTHGLLAELLKKDIPDETRMDQPAPSTLMEILEATGFDEADSQWVAVAVDGQMTNGKFSDLVIDKREVEISVYPVFAGG